LGNWKHGFFRRGIMLCDRCILNGKCECLIPDGECAVEKKAYGEIVAELTSQYGLDGIADEILVGRVAMVLIRVARAEVYEANVEVSDSSVLWGKYISDLDRMLRAFLKDLALTRAARKKMDKSNVLVDVDELLDCVTRKTSSGPTPRLSRRVSRQKVTRLSVKKNVYQLLQVPSEGLMVDLDNVFLRLARNRAMRSHVCGKRFLLARVLSNWDRERKKFCLDSWRVSGG
jgi:hypothetical protein